MSRLLSEFKVISSRRFQCLSVFSVITVCVRHNRGEVYIGQGCLCVCLSLTGTFPQDLDVTWGNGRRCPVVVQYWVDLQSVHGFRCYDNITTNVNVSEWLYSIP